MTSEPPEPRWRRLWTGGGRDAVVVAAAFAALFGAVFGPVLGSLSASFLGLEYVDHYGTQWFYWFAWTTLEEGQSPAHTDLFFYPWGKDIYGHTGANVLDAYLAVPFRMLFGPVLGYNLFFLAAMLASGLGFAAFARELTEDRVAIGVGAALFAFTPYVLFEGSEGRPTQAILLFPVLFLWGTWRSGLRPGLAAPIAAGVMLALSGFQYWYYAFFGGMIALAHGLWRTAFPPPEAGRPRDVFGRHALIAAVALAITLPVAYPLFTASSDEIVGRFDVAQWSLTQNPPVTVEEIRVGIMAWQPFRRSVGSYVEDPDGTERFLDRVALVPLVVLPVLLWWLLRPGRLHRGPVLAMLAMGVGLALGPLLMIEQYTLPNAPYIAIVKLLPFLQRLWWPARAFAFVAVLLGLAVVVALAEARRLRLQIGAVTALVLAWIAELTSLGFAPYPTWDATIPAGYRCLATGPEGAIIELPYAWTQAHLYYQTAHGRPILGGMIEDNPVFSPDEAVALREDNTYVKGLLDLTRMQAESPVWTEEDKAAVFELGYRYVVLEKDAFGVERQNFDTMDSVRRTRLRRMRRKLAAAAGEVVYEDARIAIHAPWGDEPPCDPEANGTDPVRLGRTESTTEDLYRQDPNESTLVRIFAAPRAADTDAPSVADPK